MNTSYMNTDYLEVDYLIVGQGIAGTNLAYQLLKRQKKIFVVDAFKKNSSSQVSAGICNPITGKRLTKTWQADVIFPYLKNFYTEFQLFLKNYTKKEVDFFREIPIYRTFKSIENQNEWYVRTMQSEWEKFCAVETENNLFDSHFAPYIDNPLGGWQTLQSYHLEVKILLENFRYLLKNENILHEKPFLYENITFFEDYVCYDFLQENTTQPQNNEHDNQPQKQPLSARIKAKKIIFCEGADAYKNPFFKDLAFNLVKGEWLKIILKNTDTAHLKSIINQEGIFVLPHTDNTLTVGATYEWGNMDIEISQKARLDITQKLDNFLKIAYTIIDQQAGIRPASKNRKPFLQLHPIYPQLAVINGLGTKGISLSPYFVGLFCDFLDNGDDTQLKILSAE